jgi:ATP dependent DNA ligase domain
MFYEFSLPTKADKGPTGPDWFHKIKYDGYRLMVIRDGARVRLFSRNGKDWSGRYPWIVEAALKNNHDQFVIDGEASCWGSTGSRSSMPYTRGSTITKSSSTPSTSSRSMARIAALPSAARASPRGRAAWAAARVRSHDRVGCHPCPVQERRAKRISATNRRD